MSAWRTAPVAERLADLVDVPVHESDRQTIREAVVELGVLERRLRRVDWWRLKYKTLIAGLILGLGGLLMLHYVPAMVRWAEEIRALYLRMMFHD